MNHQLLTIGAALAVLWVPAQAEDEPKLADTAERLTADDENALRVAVSSRGPTTASRGPDLPFTRVLVVPEVLKDLYKKKPKATVRLLLKLVEGSPAKDSLHAVCCIEALVHSPEYAAITARGADVAKWDQVIGGANPLTDREDSRRACVKLIAEKEAGMAGKEKK